MELPNSVRVLDPSKTTDYLRCPRYFFFRHILGWELDRPNVHLVFGEAWHRAMRVFLLNGPTAINEASEAFMNYYRDNIPEYEWMNMAPKDPYSAMTMLNEYALHYATEERYTTLHTECLVYAPIDIAANGDLCMMCGRVDAILEDRQGRVFIMDHKTASRTTTDLTKKWSNSVQMQTYYHAGVLAYGQKFDRIVINEAVAKKRSTEFNRASIFKSDKQLYGFIKNIQYWWHSIQHELDVLESADADVDTLPCFHCNYDACNDFYGCPYQTFCENTPNPLSMPTTPPGFRVRHWDPRDFMADSVIKLDSLEGKEKQDGQ